LRALHNDPDGKNKIETARNSVTKIQSLYTTESFLIYDFQLAFDSSDGRIYIIDPGNTPSGRHNDQVLILSTLLNILTEQRFMVVEIKKIEIQPRKLTPID
jgi:hypothetical protein